MTCQECQPLAIDLARGLPPFDIGGAVQRGDVLSHIARCKRCAQWLAEQEALTEALRAAAEDDIALSAPSSVEANVMAAWRARQVQRQGANASLAVPPIASRGKVPLAGRGERPIAGLASLAGPASPQSIERPQSNERVQSSEQLESSARAWKSSWLVWPASGFAAAAAIVMFTLPLASWKWLNASPVAGGVANRASKASAGAAGAPASRSSATVRPGEAVGGGRNPADAQAGISAGVAEGRTGDRTGKSMRAPVTGTNAAVVEVLPEKGSKGRGRPTPPRGARELGGPAFVLLPYAEPLRPTEMRHIMRVRMSRTLVVAGDVQAGNAEGATVLADVLVGEDGTARAVRIVQ
jgi:hypothetical protein